MESGLSLAAYLLLLAAALISLVSLWKPGRYLQRASFWCMVLAFTCLTLALVWRGAATGRLPFATMYEFTFLFAWGILLMYIFIQKALGLDLLTSLAAMLAIVIFSYGGTLPPEARPLMPALQSVWLKFHVATAVIAYGAFGMSFCLAVLYFIKEKSPRGIGGPLPPADKIDGMIHWAVVLGFPFMTLVLITRAVWAEEVWGSWWSWDPKETWALITWLIYAGCLHARKTYGWRGKRAAIMAIAGFLAVIFTLFGVTFLLPECTVMFKSRNWELGIKPSCR